MEFLQNKSVVENTYTPHDRDWKSFLLEGNTFFDQGKYTEAFSKYIEACNNINKSSNEGDDNEFILNKCKIYMGLAKSEYQQLNFEGAIQYCNRALLKATERDIIEQIAESHHILGKIFMEQEQYEESLFNFEKAMKSLDQANSSLLKGKILNDMADLYIRQHKLDEAESALINSLKVQLKSYWDSKDRPLLSSECYRLLGDGQKQYKAALNAVIETLEYSEKKHINTSNTEKTTLLNDTIGTIFYLWSDYVQAIKYYSKSEHLKRKLFPSNNWRRVASVEYLTKVYFESDRLDNAKDYYKKLLYFKNITNTSSKISKVKLNNILGEICFKKCTYDSSRYYYDEARKSFSREKSSYKHAIEQSKSLLGIGKFHFTRNEMDIALNYYNKAKEILHGDFSDKDKLITEIFDSIAEAYMLQGNFEAARQQLGASTAIRKKFLDDEKVNIERYYQEGNLNKHCQNFNEALRLHIKSLNIRQKQKYKISLGHFKSNYEIGKIYLLLKDFQNAYGYYYKAKEIIENLIMHESIINFGLFKDFGSILELLKRYREAKEFYLKYLNATKTPANKAKIYILINEIHELPTDYVRALWNYEKAIKENDTPNTKNNGDLKKLEEKVYSTLKHFFRTKIGTNYHKSPPELILSSPDLVERNKNSSIQKEIEIEITMPSHGNDFENNDCCIRFVNIMLIGSKCQGKSYIFKLLTGRAHTSNANPDPAIVDVNKLIRQSKTTDDAANLQPHYASSAPLTVKNISYRSNKTNGNRYSNGSTVVDSSQLLQQTRSNEHGTSFYAKIWNFHDAIYYQPFKFHSNIYIITFDVNIDLSEAVENNLNDPGSRYITSIQDWLINVIEPTYKLKRFPANFDGRSEKFALPLILIIPTYHGDKLDKIEQFERRNKFIKILDRRLSSYRANLFCPKLVMEWSPSANDDNGSLPLHNDHNLKELCTLLAGFIQVIPSIVINANANTSLIDIGSAVLRSMSKIDDKKMGTVQIKPIKHKATLAEMFDIHNSGVMKFGNLFKYLHSIGDLLFCPTNKNYHDALIVNFSFFIRFLDAILSLGDKNAILPNSGEHRSYYELASKAGIVSKASIKYAASEYQLSNADINEVLHAMELSNIIYQFPGISDEISAKHDDYYFIPNLLSSYKSESKNSSSELSYSSWLYLSCSQEKVPYITDCIFYKLLSSIQLLWKVVIYQNYAKFLPRHRNYTIIIVKNNSYIGLQYYYQSDNNHDYGHNWFKAKALKSILEDQPHVKFRSALLNVVENQISGWQDAKCDYYIKCPECHGVTVCPNQIVERYIKCSSCIYSFPPATIEDWKLDDILAGKRHDSVENNFDDVTPMVIAKSKELNDNSPELSALEGNQICPGSLNLSISKLGDEGGYRSTVDDSSCRNSSKLGSHALIASPSSTFDNKRKRNHSSSEEDGYDRPRKWLIYEDALYHFVKCSKIN